MWLSERRSSCEYHCVLVLASLGCSVHVRERSADKGEIPANPATLLQTAGIR